MSRVVADTQPYPWPFDGLLRPERIAVVIAGADVAWHDRCVDPGPAFVALQGLVALRRLGVVVVGVQHRLRPPHAAQPIPGLAELLDLEVVANGLDGFFGSPLDGQLRRLRRDQLVICGFGLEGPVHSTLRSANDRGYECLTVIDASAALDAETAAAAISMITMSGGIFGAVGYTADLIGALSRDDVPTHEKGGSRGVRHGDR
jgi:biuret amidohydrolase